MTTFSGGRVKGYCGECGFFHGETDTLAPACAAWKKQADARMSNDEMDEILTRLETALNAD